MVVVCDLICAYVLCDTTSFARNNIRFADSIKKSGFTVVNVAQYTNHSRAWLEELALVDLWLLFFFLLLLGLRLSFTAVADLEKVAMILRYLLSGILFNALVH